MVHLFGSSIARWQGTSLAKTLVQLSDLAIGFWHAARHDLPRVLVQLSDSAAALSRDRHGRGMPQLLRLGAVHLSGSSLALWQGMGLAQTLVQLSGSDTGLWLAVNPDLPRALVQLSDSAAACSLDRTCQVLHQVFRLSLGLLQCGLWDLTGRKPKATSRQHWYARCKISVF